MNIEIANRLCKLRKEHNLSQEQLAEKIGVSRQAVSKWERAEASPDTDNLIALAKIYGVTVDQLLTGNDSCKQENAAREQADSQTYRSEKKQEQSTDESSSQKKSKVSFKNGIHIDDNGDNVHIGFDGIHVNDRNGTKVSVDNNGVFVEENGETKAYTDEDGHVHFSDNVKHNGKGSKSSAVKKILYSAIPLVTVAAFLVMGCTLKLWGIAWVVFLAIPIILSIPEAIRKRRPSKFCFPVLVVAVYIVLGLCCNLWHPGWIIFLTIPIYYAICSVIEGK